MRQPGEEKGKEVGGDPNWVRSGATIYGCVACLAVLLKQENEEREERERG